MAAIMTFGDKHLGARIRTAQPPPKGWLVESPVSHLRPDCVKTHLGQGRSELFSQLPLPAAPTSVIDFRGDEIKMEILRASSASEFSHSLGHCRHCPGLATLGVLVLKTLRRHENALATLDPFLNSANVD
jgi:hypothetical protein